MLTLASISAALAWVSSHLWVLLLAVVPQAMGILQPILTAIVDGAKSFISTVWEGLKSMNFQEWTVVITISAIVGIVMYHTGWNSCIDWVHAHFRLVSKVPVSHWWKFW